MHVVKISLQLDVALNNNDKYELRRLFEDKLGRIVTGKEEETLIKVALSSMQENLGQVVATLATLENLLKLVDKSMG